MNEVEVKKRLNELNDELYVINKSYQDDVKERKKLGLKQKNEMDDLISQILRKSSQITSIKKEIVKILDSINK